MKIKVVAHPNARMPRVERDLLDMMHVYIPEPPREGRANKAVIEALAEYFQVKKSEVALLSGHKSKIKLFEIASTNVV